MAESAEWFYASGDRQNGPVRFSDLQDLIANGTVGGSTLVWKQGMDEWAPASRVPGLHSGPAAGSPPPLRTAAARSPDLQQAGTTKLAAGICGILLGGLGVHKFIYGATTPGVILLLITVCTCGVGAMATGIIGLIEGIIYLTKSDEEFYETYIVGKKAWF